MRFRGSVTLIATLVVVATLAAALFGCALMPPYRNDARMRLQLQTDYPGFRVTRLAFDNDDPGFPSDGSRLTRYSFDLESQDVPGFKLYGSYYLLRSGPPEGWGPRDSMFSGQGPTRPQLIELERMWVKRFPSVAIEVGDDSMTGPLSPDDVLQSNDVVATKYADVELGEVFRLWGDQDELDGWRPGSFFRLNPQSGRWTYLPGFMEPGWMQDD